MHLSTNITFSCFIYLFLFRISCFVQKLKLFFATTLMDFQLTYQKYSPYCFGTRPLRPWFSHGYLDILANVDEHFIWLILLLHHFQDMLLSCQLMDPFYHCSTYSSFVSLEKHLSHGLLQECERLFDLKLRFQLQINLSN